MFRHPEDNTDYLPINVWTVLYVMGVSCVTVFVFIDYFSKIEEKEEEEEEDAESCKNDHMLHVSLVNNE